MSQVCRVDGCPNPVTKTLTVNLPGTGDTQLGVCDEHFQSATRSKHTKVSISAQVAKPKELEPTPPQPAPTKKRKRPVRRLTPPKRRE